MPLCCCSLLPGLQGREEQGTALPDHTVACRASSEQAGFGGPPLHLAASLLQGQTQVASAGGVPIRCLCTFSLTESAPSFPLHPETGTLDSCLQPERHSPLGTHSLHVHSHPCDTCPLSCQCLLQSLTSHPPKVLKPETWEWSFHSVPPCRPLLPPSLSSGMPYSHPWYMPCTLDVHAPSMFFHQLK